MLLRNPNTAKKTAHWAIFGAVRHDEIGILARLVFDSKLNRYLTCLQRLLARTRFCSQSSAILAFRTRSHA